MADSGTAYSAILARCVLRQAGSAVDARVVLGECGIGEALLGSEHGMVSSGLYLRLWERAEFHRGDPAVGVALARDYRLGQLGVFDYLFSTAPTVADGLAAIRRSPAAMATNHRYREADSDRDGERTTVLELVEGEGRGAELTVQAAYATTLGRIRQTTGVDVVPARVTLSQPAPRRAGPFVAAFGTDRIEFGASADSMTLRTRDLELPLRTADPVLATIVHGHADAAPTPLLDDPSWPERVQRVLADILPTGEVSLEVVARRLSVGHRTLQRRLAEAGTTWRRELDSARAAAARGNGRAHSQAALAARLGYSDPRALRRAVRRWNTQPPRERAG
ncbi:AraC family transcriptional regulator ligand-binding domain-containing protein [Nocardia terrae]|uniref:AraC family transcriptional regulator ligand-binding domain-containing protein n=1 Tax=Nocardia terrae TaxID=2675851 RepID=UPI0012F72FCE|nr:AraC family transcriptional regulator ligand-binding domain-containing protein [Nocardia terrae]